MLKPCRAKRSGGLLLAVMFMAAVAAHAQTVTTYEEAAQRIKGSREVSGLKGDLFGDKVNLYTGALEFIQTDVSLPGSFPLPVAITRRLSTGAVRTGKGLFGDWDLDLPRLEGVFSTAGWLIDSTQFADGDPLKRCSQFSQPPEATAQASTVKLMPDLFWGGNYLVLPGAGPQEMLQRGGTPQAPTDGGNGPATYPVVTASGWQFRCLPGMAPGNGFGGEAFVAVSPDGTQYKFDWMVERSYPSVSVASSIPVGGTSANTATVSGGATSADAAAGQTVIRKEVLIYPTEIKDRFGNTVTYTYDSTNPWQLRTIQASDGRRLTLTYANSALVYVSNVTDGERYWVYGYNKSSGSLTSVRLPDNSQWQFSGSSLQAGVSYLTSPTYCADRGTLATDPLIKTITHPSGAIGTFTLTPTEHGRSFVGVCTSAFDSPFVYYATRALTKKTITGPGISAYTWTYDYGPVSGGVLPCTGCSGTKVVTVTDPRNSITKQTFGTRWRVDEGLLLRSEEGYGTPEARVTTFHYRSPSAGPYPDPAGISPNLNPRGDNYISSRHNPLDKRVVTVQGKDFSWEATAFDEFARPVTVTRAGTGGSRTETTKYHDNLNIWALGKIETVTTSSGVVMVRNEYDPSNSALLGTQRFEGPKTQYTYHTDGTLSSIADGLNHKTYLNDYMLGIARQISYSDGSAVGAEVNYLGLVTSVTDGEQRRTQYDYDSAGRLYLITPPSGWTPTSLALEKVQSEEYGLAAGHWRQIVSKGDARTETYYDGMLRPVLTRTYDASKEASTRKVVVKQFDADGRVVGESYPRQLDIADVAAAVTGTRSFYDAVGRVIRQEQDSELGVLVGKTEYLDGFRVKHTNPKGKATTQTLSAFDNPDESAIASIELPLGINVAMSRDVFGKPLSITRSGPYGTGTLSATRSYVYDPVKQRLCKTIDPETRATVQDYDGAGNLAWRVVGLALPDTSSCNTAEADAAASAKIKYDYDELNRLKRTSFGDLSPDINRTYWLNGLPRTVASNGSTWTYTYNSVNLLGSEVLNYAGHEFAFNYSYTADGNLSSLTYPSKGPTVAYNPNALGEPQMVSGYASSVAFHPNGAVAGYVLEGTAGATGLAHALDQNVRGLPKKISDGGVLNDEYTYDENGNVTAITDKRVSPPDGSFNRTMGYDDLDRLTSASAPGAWGIATYTYDPLDNIRTANVGTRTAVLAYDPRNRLATATIGGSAVAYTYDDFGNVRTKGQQSFWFDVANRMTSSSLGGAYAYDGLERRIKIKGLDGKERFQAYSQAGQLLWASTFATGDEKATVSRYTCPGTMQLANGMCVGTDSLPSENTPQCPSGYNYSQSLGKCMQSESVDRPADSETKCPDTYSPVGQSCVKTDRVQASSSCPTGYSYSSATSKCTIPATTSAIVKQTCAAGSLSNGICIVDTYPPAEPIRICPQNYQLQGNSCVWSHKIDAVESLTCLGKGSPTPYSPSETGQMCFKQDVYLSGGGDYFPYCDSVSGGLSLVDAYPKSGKFYTCVFGPVYQYSCPRGQLTDLRKCLVEDTADPTITGYLCTMGALQSNNTCYVPVSSTPISQYSCPANYQLQADNTCKAPTPVVDASYQCASGYTPQSDNYCTKVVTADPTTTYSCPADLSVSNGRCIGTITRTADATWKRTCKDGYTLQTDNTCKATSVPAVPVYSCPNGGALAVDMCRGAQVESGVAYIYLAGKQIAETAIATTSVTQYAHTDALGSPVAHTNVDGWVLNRTRFEPYGYTAQGTKPGPATSAMGFTGHANDPETDLVYMQQRYYDPIAGRFLSVDPVVTDANTGKMFGRYRYVDNNPYAKVDPDGREPNDAGNLERPQPLAGLRQVMNDFVAGGKAAVSSAVLPNVPTGEVAKVTVTVGYVEGSLSVNKTGDGSGSVFVGVRTTPGLAIQATQESKIGSAEGLTVKASMSAGVGPGATGSVSVSTGSTSNPLQAQASGGVGLKTEGIYGIRPPAVTVGWTVKLDPKDTAAK